MLWCRVVNMLAVCGAKVKSENEPLGQCTKCQLKMKISKRKTARVIITSKDNKPSTLTMFNDIIDTIIDGADGENLTMKLLAASSMLTLFFLLQNCKHHYNY